MLCGPRALPGAAGTRASVVEGRPCTDQSGGCSDGASGASIPGEPGRESRRAFRHVSPILRGPPAADRSHEEAQRGVLHLALDPAARHVERHRHEESRGDRAGERAAQEPGGRLVPHVLAHLVEGEEGLRGLTQALPAFADLGYEFFRSSRHVRSSHSISRVRGKNTEPTPDRSFKPTRRPMRQTRPKTVATAAAAPAGERGPASTRYSAAVRANT